VVTDEAVVDVDSVVDPPQAATTRIKTVDLASLPIDEAYANTAERIRITCADRVWLTTSTSGSRVGEFLV
jgi:hypothetical protein